MDGNIYTFNPDDVYSFASKIQAQTKQRGDELQFIHCPYCRGGSGGKDKGTFSVNLKTGQFKCLRASCGVTGNMVVLAKDFDFQLSGYAGEYYNPRKQFRTLPQPKKPIEPKPQALEFLQKRGISDRVAKEYEITVRTDNPNVLVFPFYDENGKLQCIKYRDTQFNKSKGGNKEWFEKNTKPILFGMKQCVDKQTLVCTEGQLDSLALAEAGIPNAVSVPNGAKGFTWLPYCWEWINSFEEVIVFGDYEKGHITLLDELSKRLKTTVKHVREDDYKDCKDANDILRKYGTVQLKTCVENAVNIPIRQVVDLADVRIGRDEDSQFLETHIRQIDAMLYGGLPLGGITLITAKSGVGKSTLASQLVIRGLEKGYKAFIYSGELSNENFKRWFNFQIAGRDRILEYSNKWGDIRYRLSDVNNANISEWYRDRCFIFDSTDIEGGEELTSLVELTENVVMQYGVKVVLIDNLMTALDLERVGNNDRFEKQSLFVKKLARLALKHGVLVLLVAHKRKNNFSQGDNDEVMGSSDITNLASVVLSYDKDKDIEPNQRLCRLTKNRLYGVTNTDGILLNFDAKSKRIFEPNRTERDDFDFKWDMASDGFDLLEDSPFD
jgi:archaellum biogenesis ATPase FlaH